MNTGDARCFQRTVRRSIDNSQPIVELFYVTPHQCIDHCIYVTNNNPSRAKLCLCFVYDYLQHSCRLYDHDGNQPPAILHPAENYDYFKRTATLNQCAGPGSPTTSANSKSSSNGTYWLKLTSTGSKSQQSQIFLRNSNAVREADQKKLSDVFITSSPSFLTGNNFLKTVSHVTLRKYDF
ncbi:unnamed protein product [Gongylonema pulchrum]|uniref:Apple domain-containing protein n=1 Tax=Gongylonema pulchrum TaxID=637853 RepID=A0A183EWR6_9BILA|nr:unnamed protein product [Gongylonema pulchrum]